MVCFHVVGDFPSVEIMNVQFPFLNLQYCREERHTAKEFPVQ